MKLVPTPLHGMFVAETEVRGDARGTFARLYCRDDLSVAVGKREIVQANESRTRAVGAIRGLHFQHKPHAEMKLVRCLRGAAFDVAVDLRAGSPTFLHWHAVELTPENARMVVIPEGCAHGFQTLAPDTELLYLHTSAYAHSAEDGVAWNDATIGVRWPLPLPGRDGLSERDCALPTLAPSFAGLAA